MPFPLTLIPYVYISFVPQTYLQPLTNNPPYKPPSKRLTSTMRISYKMFFQNVTLFLLKYATLSISLCIILALSAAWRFILNFSVFFVPSWLNLYPLFAFSAPHSLTSAATAQQLHGGRHTGAFRCTCAISAASAEPTAAQISQFGGCSLTSACHFGGIFAQFAHPPQIKTEAFLPLSLHLNC